MSKMVLLDKTYTGLCLYGNDYYYVAQGQVNFDYTGLGERMVSGIT